MQDSNNKNFGQNIKFIFSLVSFLFIVICYLLNFEWKFFLLLPKFKDFSTLYEMHKKFNDHTKNSNFQIFINIYFLHIQFMRVVCNNVFNDGKETATVTLIKRLVFTIQVAVCYDSIPISYLPTHLQCQ